MRENCEDFIVKLNKIETDQEAEKRDHVAQNEKIEELYGDLHDIRQARIRVEYYPIDFI